MNGLTKFLVDHILLEEEGVTALFGGGFKPPTKGHLEVVLKGLKENPEVNRVIIYVGSGVRNNVSQEEAVKIWKMFQKLIPVPSEIIATSSPFKAYKDYLESHPEETTYVFIGGRPGNEGDALDIAERSKYVGKYNGIPKVVQTSDALVSGTAARAAAKISKERFTPFLPDELPDNEKDLIYSYINSVVKESEDVDFIALEAELDKMFDELDIDINFTKHFKERVIERGLSTDDIIELAQKIIDRHGDIVADLPKDQNVVMSHLSRLIDIAAMSAGYGEDYLKDLVFKTAFKRNDAKEPGLRTNASSPRLAVSEDLTFEKKRNLIKKIIKLANSTGGHMSVDQLADVIARRITIDTEPKPAPGTFKVISGKPFVENLKEHSMGNSIDMLPKLAELTDHMIKKGYKIEPLPGLKIIEDDISNAEDFLGKTAYYDPNTQTIVLYTHGRHPKDIARSYAHEMIHHMQNLEGRLGNITTTNTQEDDYLNDIEAEANLKGTMTFRNWTDSLEEKKNKDPFGLNQYARELAQGLEEAIVNEGVYDSLTTKLTKATIQKWVADFKKNPKLKSSFIDLDIEDVDGKGRDIEFNYVGMLKFDKKVDGYVVDGTSNSGEEEDKIPFIATLFTVNPKVLPQAWSQMSADVSDVIRHEIEHLTQSGENVRGQVYDDEGNLIDKGKYMDDDIMIRDMINKLKILPKSDYYKLEKEVDAMLQGLYLKAKKTKKPFADVINNYLDIAPGIETKEDKEIILNLWRNRRKALSLPVFENKEVMDYIIYSDMDGVLSDFDKRFMQFSDGIPPSQYEEKFGKQAFWKLIDGTVGVPFWAGMDWMSDGKQYWDYIKKYNPIILSAPSQNNESKYGKRIWKKRNMPENRMILVPAWKKQEFAAPNAILIDDRKENIDQWVSQGGIGILHTDATSTIAQLKKLGL